MTITFTKVSGDGDDALYNLSLDGKTVGKNLSLDEVMEIIRKEDSEDGEL